METGKNDNQKVEVNQSVFFRALGTTYKVLSNSVGGAAAIVEHTLEAKSLGAPMHKHTHENEISCILEGELSVIQNGEVQTAGPGQYIVKPKGIFFILFGMQVITQYVSLKLLHLEILSIILQNLLPFYFLVKLHKWIK